MPRKKITETLLKQFKVEPPAERIELTDQRCPPLVVRINPSSKVTFTVAFRPPRGKPRRITIGDWPDLSLHAARDEADRILETSDETTKCNALNLIDGSFATLWPEYLEGYLKHSAKRSWELIDLSARKHVMPRVGSVPIRMLTRKKINRVLDEVRDNVGTSAAHRVRNVFSGFLNWAVDEELIHASPMAGLRRPDLTPNMNAGKEASDLQIKFLYQAAQRMHQLGSQYGKCLQLIMLTGIRRSNWGLAKREWLDLENRWMVIPVESQKSSREELVPLSNQAMKVIEDIPSWAGPYLFSKRGTSGDEGLTAFSKPVKLQRQLADEMYQAYTKDEDATLPRLRAAHDWKVTLGSRLARLGISPEVRTALLQHSRGKLAQIYEKYDYLAEKREAMQLYADHLMEIVDG